MGHGERRGGDLEGNIGIFVCVSFHEKCMSPLKSGDWVTEVTLPVGQWGL